MLLAKSGKPELNVPPISLHQHTLDVETALKQLRVIWPQLPLSLEAAARFHDLGKAADGFQQMLEGGQRWKFRHEILSAAIFRACFDINEPDFHRAYLALLTHHKNLGGEMVNDAFLEAQTDLRFPEHCQWFKKWRELRALDLKAEFSDDLINWTFKPDAASPANEVEALMNEMPAAFADLSTALARGALVAADHLASGGFSPTLQGHNITRGALENAVQRQLQARGVEWLMWSQIQNESAQTRGSALLIAPTGAGKTEAALLWALNNRQGSERIFYVLPYQVSINTMAERISKAFPDTERHTRRYENENVAILHSSTDLAYLQDALNDQVSPEKAAVIALTNRDAARKIYSPIKVTTVYQLLDIFFGRKFFEVGLLELTNSLVIFDEIHAYDGHTMGLIMVMLGYLRRLGAQVFIMTATLPGSLKIDLLEAAEIKQEITLPENDPLLLEVRRLVQAIDRSIEEMVSEIRRMVVAGKKTVVVCNTVDKAIHLQGLLADLDPLLVHSRFTLGDRSKRESKENLERPEQKLIISTQVIEVSLDISFDVMFTELAPADALLQRFGRVNRHGPAKLFGLCYIACDGIESSKNIYNASLLEATRNHVPKELLNFETASRWIEQVYPNGLPEKEAKKMQEAKNAFSKVVAEIRPMMDIPDLDLEKNLFESEQVIPARYAKDWVAHKDNGRHLDAKQLIVNVNKKVWMAKCKDYGEAAFVKVWFKKREFVVALFDYDEDKNGKFDGTGLRLDGNPVANPLAGKQFFYDGEDE